MGNEREAMTLEKIKRMRDVADGLRRIQEFESALYLDEYADHLLRAAEPICWAKDVSDDETVVSWSREPPEFGKGGWWPLYTHPPEPARDAKCKWSQDVDGNWETDCGNLHILIDGTPYDNEMGFCCYCGHAIDQVLYHDAAMAQESGK